MSSYSITVVEVGNEYKPWLPSPSGWPVEYNSFRLMVFNSNNADVLFLWKYTLMLRNSDLGPNPQPDIIRKRYARQERDHMPR